MMEETFFNQGWPRIACILISPSIYACQTILARNTYNSFGYELAGSVESTEINSFPIDFSLITQLYRLQSQR
jgi:hypothetical protein